MEFSAYAATETSALLTRVLAESSQASLQRVEALRAALDTASKALEAALATPPDTDDKVTALVTRLTKAATADGDGRLKRLTSEARKITETLRADLEEQTKEKDALAASLEKAQADADAVRAEVLRAQKEAQDIRQQLADAQAAHKTLDAARAEATAARDAEAKATAAIAIELRDIRGQLDTTQAEAARALAARDLEAGARARIETELQGVRGGLATTSAEAARTAAQLKATAAEKAKLEAALSAATSRAAAAETEVSAATTLVKSSAARVQALEREQHEHALAARDLQAKLRASEAEAVSAAPTAALPVLDSLLRGFESLSAAGTVDDVLTTLIEQLAAEFPRVALFRVKGNRLEGAHQIGFALTNDIGKVMMPLAMDSVLTRAVSSGRTERVSGDDLLNASGLPFGGAPVWALAAPIVVDGESLAVIYADDSGQSRPERHPAADDLSARFAEALRQHAVALLVRMTREMKGQADVRAYAGSLFDEVEQMYRADEAAGKTGADLQKRLHANLDYARSIFATRTEFESPAAAGLLEAQLAGMIDLHRDSSLGRDLAVVSGWTDGGAARAAEAS